MATITLPAAIVIEAAIKTIAHIEATRTTMDEEAIAQAMKPRKFLGFNLKARTREEAINYCSEASYGWHFPSQIGWGDLAKAKNLLRLAKLGDPVTLNEEDVRVLF